MFKMATFKYCDGDCSNCTFAECLEENHKLKKEPEKTKKRTMTFEERKWFEENYER